MRQLHTESLSLQQKIDCLTPGQIEELIADSRCGDDKQLRQGHQATVHIVSIDGQPVVIKSVTRLRSSLVWLRRRMLVNEYKVYQRLAGLAGTPKCYGLIKSQYLALEFIDGTAFQDLQFPLERDVYDSLLELIQGLHERGVAHADLKRRSNLILGHGGKPFLIDFGTAIVRKDGFRPINHFLFRSARQLDYHGYIKNKYRERPGPIHESDLEYYRPMRIEQAARWIKRNFRRRIDALREKHAQR